MDPIEGGPSSLTSDVTFKDILKELKNECSKLEIYIESVLLEQDRYYIKKMKMTLH